MSLNEQAQEILRIAEQHGVEQNFFFLTTFKRYQVQLQILNDLEKTIKEDGTLVTKEYVKGRKGLLFSNRGNSLCLRRDLRPVHLFLCPGGR